MDNLKSVLIFEKYVVNKIEFIRNEEFNIDEKTKIDFKILKNVKRFENKMEVTLDTIVFENAKENNYPFEMKVQITGFFSLENETKINLEPNAVAILYPYVRAIVSTYTANANVNALILPPINVNSLFKDEK